MKNTNQKQKIFTLRAKENKITNDRIRAADSHPAPLCSLPSLQVDQSRPETRVSRPQTQAH